MSQNQSQQLKQSSIGAFFGKLNYVICRLIAGFSFYNYFKEMKKRVSLNKLFLCYIKYIFSLIDTK